MHRMDVQQLNTGIGIFVRQLRLMKQNQHKIDDNTVELFMHAIRSIDELIEYAPRITAPDNSNINFLFNLNEREFELKQKIRCKLCLVNI